MSAPGRPFSHRAGQHQFASDYQRILEARRTAEAIPAEVRGVMRLAAVVLVLSPVILWIAWKSLHAASRDILVQDNGQVLVACGLGAITFAASQIVLRSTRLIWLRKSILWSAMVASLVVAAGYVFVGVRARMHATASLPERTYELHYRCGRHCTYSIHQRPDGTTLEGTDNGRPVQYASTCTLAQRLDGERGFSWVRVLDRSRAPGRGQLAWPIRREECFSDIPLASLPK